MGEKGKEIKMLLKERLTLVIDVISQITINKDEFYTKEGITVCLTPPTVLL